MEKWELIYHVSDVEHGDRESREDLIECRQIVNVPTHVYVVAVHVAVFW